VLIVSFDIRSWLLRHAKTNRVLVGPHIDASILDLASGYPKAKIYSVDSGSMLFDWIVPNAWDCKCAKLIDPTGKVLADFKTTPLAVWAHSLPWNEKISKRDLADHVFAPIPGNTVWQFTGSYRPLEKCKGFSLPSDIWDDAPVSGKYEAVIESKEWPSRMKAIEIVLPGDSERSILFSAHLCHPGQVADGIGNVAILLELLNNLSRLKKRRFTYRFLFGPEGYASALWLKHNTDLPIAVLCVDMLLAESPLLVQLGYRETWLNVIARALDKEGCRGFRSVWGNDERWWKTLRGKCQPWVYFAIDFHNIIPKEILFR